MKITFEKQIKIGLTVMIIGFVLHFFTNKGLFINIAWIINGLLFIVNHAPPEKYRYHPNMRKYLRITGVVIFILGIITRFNIG